MDIRLANKHEKEQIIQLWQLCFNDIGIYVEWFFKTMYEPENTVVAVEDGRVISAAQMLPHKLNIYNDIIPVNYIVGVSTHPNYRGKGIAASIMQKVFELSLERGYAFNMLYPTVENYYERFGYVPIAYYNEYAIKYINENTPIYKSANGQDLSLLDSIYEEYLCKSQVYIIRSKKMWTNILEDYSIAGGGAYIVFDKKRLPCGYFLYTDTKSKIRISELAYTSDDGIRGILGVAMSLSNVKVKSFRLPVFDNVLDEILDDAYVPKIATANENQLYTVNKRLGAMLQTVDRAKAEEFYKKNASKNKLKIKALNDADFTKVFFEDIQNIYINLAGWN